MATLELLPPPGGVRSSPEQWPANFEFMAEGAPLPESTQVVVADYNERFAWGGKAAIFGGLEPKRQAANGLSFAVAGEPSKTLILLVNPFGNGLVSASKRFRGRFLHDNLAAAGVTGPDGQTPQVVQVGVPSRDSNIPLSLPEHVQVAKGNTRPIADKVAELIFTEFPKSEQIISVGYSLAGFLSPDILMSLQRQRDILAGMIANPPGVESMQMAEIRNLFAKARAGMNGHLMSGGLDVLDPRLVNGPKGLLPEKAAQVADVIWRPANLSLWVAFTRGKLLEKVQTMKATVPNAEILFAFGREDPICSPDSLETYLRATGLQTAVIENGDHAWGYNLPRSMGSLATQQIKQVLQPDQRQPAELALAA